MGVRYTPGIHYTLEVPDVEVIEVELCIFVTNGAFQLHVSAVSVATAGNSTASEPQLFCCVLNVTLLRLRTCDSSFWTI